MSIIDRTVEGLRGWQRFTRAVEALLIDNIAATSPWLAPLIPAYLAWDSMSNILAFPPWVALAGAAVVELLGLSAVSTTFQFWDYNDTRRKSDQRAPVLLAITTALFYLCVVLTVNVMLDSGPALHKAAKALLSTLSVCAAVVLALRAGHSRRLESIEHVRAERRARRHTSEINYLKKGNLPEIADWRALPLNDREVVKGMTTRQVVSRYGVSERTARNWRRYAEERHNGHRVIETLAE
jgi:hypothetical protein